MRWQIFFSIFIVSNLELLENSQWKRLFRLSQTPHGYVEDHSFFFFFLNTVVKNSFERLKLKASYFLCKRCILWQLTLYPLKDIVWRDFLLIANYFNKWWSFKALFYQICVWNLAWPLLTKLTGRIEMTDNLQDRSGIWNDTRRKYSMVR